MNLADHVAAVRSGITGFQTLVREPEFAVVPREQLANGPDRQNQAILVLCNLLEHGMGNPGWVQQQAALAAAAKAEPVPTVAGEGVVVGAAKLGSDDSGELRRQDK